MFKAKSIEKWSDAHVFYDAFNKHRSNIEQNKCITDELTWRKKNLKSPNGKLLLHNWMFDSIKSYKKVYLLHATTKLKSILENNALYPSAGCLVGSIYCTPLFSNTKSELELHNLGQYITKKEAINSIRLRNDGAKLDTLVIEIEKTSNPNSPLIGIDYTKLGHIHLDIFEGLKYLLSKEECTKLQNFTMYKIRDCIDFLTLINRSYLDCQTLNQTKFYTLLAKVIEKLPILGYLYFETLAEYLMLYGQDNNYKDSYIKGEFYNFDYKEFMFNSYESLLKNFNLAQFSPTPQMLTKYFEKNKDINIQHMLEYIQEKLIFLINSRLFSCSPINWDKINWNYEDLIETRLEPLVGHLIHRELRNYSRYRDFYFYFDQLKALQIWNYWNHMGIQIPFNGIIPKGEIGINPAFPNLKYKVYNSIITKDNRVELGSQLDIEIIPRLVDLKNTFMRVHCKENLS